MNEPHAMTLWQVVDALIRQAPLNRTKVESVLSVQLRTQHHDRHVDWYESDPIVLADQVVIEDVDLRTDAGGGGAGFLVLPLGGACVSPSQIRSHFSHVYLSSLPDSPAPERLKFYSTDVPWGKLHFGFRQGNPDCLATLSFDPREDMSLRRID